jgi:hypothetical protein
MNASHPAPPMTLGTSGTMSPKRRTPMRALALYAGFVILCTVGAVLIGKSIESYTSPDIGSLVMLGLFFVGLVVSWIVTVLVMDGSLKNFKAEKEQLEAEKNGREYEARNR